MAITEVLCPSMLGQNPSFVKMLFKILIMASHTGISAFSTHDTLSVTIFNIKVKIKTYSKKYKNVKIFLKLKMHHNKMHLQPFPKTCYV